MSSKIWNWELPESIKELVKYMGYCEAWALFKYLISDEGSDEEAEAWSELCNCDNWIWYASWIVIKEYNKE